MGTKPKRVVPRTLIVFALTSGMITGTALMAEAATSTVTMDELSPRPVVNVLVEGVNMNFSLNGSLGTDSTFNFNTGETFDNLTDPVLEGNANGTLVFGFKEPTTRLRFGIARNTTSTLSPGAVVEIFFAGTSISETFNVTLSPVCRGCLAEGRFRYSNRFHPIDHVFITFPGADGERFAVDNVQFEQP